MWAEHIQLLCKINIMKGYTLSDVSKDWFITYDNNQFLINHSQEAKQMDAFLIMFEQIGIINIARFSSW